MSVGFHLHRLWEAGVLLPHISMLVSVSQDRWSLILGGCKQVGQRPKAPLATPFLFCCSLAPNGPWWCVFSKVINPLVGDMLFYLLTGLLHPAIPSPHISTAQSGAPPATSFISFCNSNRFPPLSCNWGKLRSSAFPLQPIVEPPSLLSQRMNIPSALLVQKV